MSKQPDFKPTISHPSATPTPSPHPASKPPTTSPHKTEKERPGASIINSTDPSTEALRRWALDKQLQYPGQDGSFAQGANTAGVVDGMAWGGPWLLPHKGDTLPPPDEKVVHGEARVVGAGAVEGMEGKEGEGEGEEGKTRKRRSWAGLLRRGKSGVLEGKGKGEGEGERGGRSGGGVG